MVRKSAQNISKSKPRTTNKNDRYSRLIHGRALLRLFAIGFLIYAVAAGLSGLKLGYAAISSARVDYVVLTIALIASSYVFAALTYKALSPKRLPFMPTFLVQVSGGLVNRMLPAGLGGMGLNLFYLKKRGLSTTVAATVAAANNLLGFIGNLLLIIFSLLLMPVDYDRLSLPRFPAAPMVGLLVGGIALCAGILLLPKLAKKLGRIVADIKAYAAFGLHRPGMSLAALLSSIMLTALHGAGLLAVLYALHVPLSWTVALLAISIGAFAGAAVPTPGGLGGAEAGIAAVLTAFGLPLTSAVTAALVYRCVTYWLPLLPGYIALRIVEKRYL